MNSVAVRVWPGHPTHAAPRRAAPFYEKDTFAVALVCVVCLSFLAIVAVVAIAVMDIAGYNEKPYYFAV
jgi:hypothetical protein